MAPGFTLMAGSINNSSPGAGVLGEAAGLEGSFSVYLIEGLAGSLLSEAGGSEGAVELLEPLPELRSSTTGPKRPL